MRTRLRAEVMMRGSRLANRYEVVEVLGAGGFGKTYVAKDTQRPGQPEVVVKHLAPSSPSDEVLSLARRLFQTEAETLERLGRHSRIPQLLAYFAEGDEFFLVEQYVRGHRLNEELGHHKQLPELSVLSFVCELLHILVFVHGEGVIHRDIKPSNIIREHASGRLFLIDFGAVKDVGAQLTGLDTRYADTIGVGSQGYAAPEQLAGRPKFASDIYAVGTIAIQALTGRYPFELPVDPRTSELIWRDVADVTDDVAEVMTLMTRHHLADRYASAVEPLNRLVEMLPIDARDAIFTESGPRSAAPSIPLLFKPRMIEVEVCEPTQTVPPMSRSQEQTETRQDLRKPGSHSDAAFPLNGERPSSSNHSEPPAEPASEIRAGVSVDGAVSRVRGINRIALSAVLAVGAIVVGVAGWRWSSSTRQPVGPTASASASTKPAAQTCAHERMSLGEKILASGQRPVEKEEGARSFVSGDYAAAKKAYARVTGDVEAAIYRLNASTTLDAPILAAIAPLSESADRADQLLRGIARSQAGARGDVRVRVAIVDDGDDPALAEELASCLANDTRILAVIGHATSGTTLAAAPIYEQRGLVMVSALSSAVELSDAGAYVFRTMPSDRHAARALALHMSKLGKKRTALFLNAKHAYSRSFAKELRDAIFYAGAGTVVAEFDMSSPADNAYENVKKAENEAADALVLAAGSGTLDRALQVIHVNRGRLPIFAGDGMYLDKTLQVGGEYAQGMVLAVPSAVTAAPDWVRESERRKITWRSLLAYDATECVLESLMGGRTRADVKRRLASPDFALEGAAGEVRFDANGDRIGGVELVVVRRSKDRSMRFERF